MAAKTYQVAFNGQPVDAAFYADVMSLTVDERSDAPTTLQLRLASCLNDNGSWAYFDDERLAPFTHVSVKIGFTGAAGLAGALGGPFGGPAGDDGLVPVFDGYITTLNAGLGSQPGDNVVDVTGLDTTALLGLEEKTITFADMSDSDVAQQLLGAYGVRVQADPTATVHAQNDTILVQRGTDAQFIRQLARRNGFEFYFETDARLGDVVAYFQQPRLDGPPQPDLAIRFGDDSNLSRFSVRLDGQRPLSVIARQVDVTEADSLAGQASDTVLRKLGATDQNTLVGGPLGLLIQPRLALGEMLVLGHPTSNATELQTIAQVVRDEAAWFIEASGEVNTDAYQAVLRPHRLVMVKGAGREHSGRYYVTAVSHELTADGRYVQRFEARRNARDVADEDADQFGANDLGLPVPGR